MTLRGSDESAFRESFRSEMRGRLGSIHAANDAPDLSDAILNEVGRRRDWLSGADRRAIRFGRWGVVAVALLALGGALVAQRVAPVETVIPAAAPERPIAEFVRTVSSEAQQTTGFVAQVVPSAPLGEASVRLISSVASEPAPVQAERFVASGAFAPVTVRASVPGADALAGFRPEPEFRWPSCLMEEPASPEGLPLLPPRLRAGER